MPRGGKGAEVVAEALQNEQGSVRIDTLLGTTLLLLLFAACGSEVQKGVSSSSKEILESRNPDGSIALVIDEAYSEQIVEKFPGYIPDPESPLPITPKTTKAVLILESLAKEIDKLPPGVILSNAYISEDGNLRAVDQNARVYTFSISQ